MKKQLLMLGALAIAGIGSANAQTVFLQDFESTTAPALPTGWTQQTAAVTAGVGWKTGTSATLGSSYFAMDAHTKFIAVNDDATQIADNANTILKTPVFSLSGITNPYLSFDLAYTAYTETNPSLIERLIVEVSTNGGTSFTAIDTLDGNVSSWWESRFISLNAYAGMNNLMVAFRYKDDGGWAIGAALDNVKVFGPSAVDMALTSLTPAPGTLQAYKQIGSAVTIAGSVFNNTPNPVSTYNVKYTVNGGTAANYTVTGANVPAFGSAAFTHSVPYTIPSGGDFAVKAWVEAAGDADHSNDTANTVVTGVTSMPVKRLFIEEGTGTWCGYCVRGIVFMDSLNKMHGDKVSLVAVHNADPMVVTAYDNFIGAFPGFTGYPGVLVDRRKVVDPSDLFDIYNTEGDYFGFADITLGALSITGTNVSLPVTVKPALNLNGDYRLALVLTEDKVSGTTTAYNQRNYYTNNQLGPLAGGGYNFATMPDPIPASQIHYDFVARGIFPSPTGSAGTLPTTMTAGSSYNATLTGTLNAAWNAQRVHAVVALIRNSDGVVLNSNNVRFPNSVANTATSVNNMGVFPNPAADLVNVRIDLKEATDVFVSILDMTGREVATKNMGRTQAGVSTVALPLSSIAAGLYQVKVQTTEGQVTQRLSVVK